MAEMASRRDEVLTESALNRNTPAAGSSIAMCLSSAYGFPLATIMKLTAHSAYDTCVRAYIYIYIYGIRYMHAWLKSKGESEGVVGAGCEGWIWRGWGERVWLRVGGEKGLSTNVPVGTLQRCMQDSRLLPSLGDTKTSVWAKYSPLRSIYNTPRLLPWGL